MRGVAATFRRALRTPLRRPRITTRLLMIVVAVVAVGIWAVMNVPRALDEMAAYQDLAEYHADMEQRSRGMERESLGRSRVIQSQLDNWQRHTTGADELTERFFVSRRELYDADARNQRERAAHHASLKDRYRQAIWLVWFSTTPHAPPRANPLWTPPLVREPVKIFEVMTEGRVSVAFAPSGAGLAVGGIDGTIQLLELPSRRLLATFPEPEKDAHIVTFSHDGSTLFALGDGRVVRRWDVKTRQVEQPIPWSDQKHGQPGPLDFATAMACSPDGRTIAVASGGFEGKPSKAVAAVRVLDARTGKLNWEHRSTGSWAYSVAFSPDGATVACCASAAMVFDSRNGELKKILKPASGFVVGVAFSPDGRILAGIGAGRSGSSTGAAGSGRVTLWETGSGNLVRTLDGPTGHPIQVVFSPDGRKLAAAGTGPEKTSWEKSSGQRSAKTPSEVRLWDAGTGKLVWIAEGECNAASSLTFASDGRSLAFCDEEYVYCVDVESGGLKQIVMETRPRPSLHNRVSARGTSPPVQPRIRVTRDEL